MFAGLIKTFFVNGFKIHLGADEFLRKQPINVFDQKIIYLVKDLIGAFEGVKTMGLPPVDALTSLIENELDANFHFSFNSPHIFFTFHAKASGLKPIIEKIKTL